MAEAQRTSQQKIIELKRGLFVVRYASTENDPGCVETHLVI
jgi:hypothetical protein